MIAFNQNCDSVVYNGIQVDQQWLGWPCQDRVDEEGGTASVSTVFTGVEGPTCIRDSLMSASSTHQRASVSCTALMSGCRYHSGEESGSQWLVSLMLKKMAASL